MLPWLIRGVLAVGVLVVALAALGSRSPAQPAAAPPAATPGLAPAPPTPTVEPFVQRVVSRVARETPGPFPTSTPLPDGAALVSMVDFGYMPGIIRIRAGQTVVWRNDGREVHDATGDDWHSGPLEPTMEYRQTFGTPGMIPYRCTIHPDMVGTIIVS
jgi:plastocyanin